jgi:hypothetical protein
MNQFVELARLIFLLGEERPHLSPLPSKGEEVIGRKAREKTKTA